MVPDCFPNGFPASHHRQGWRKFLHLHSLRLWVLYYCAEWERHLLGAFILFLWWARHIPFQILICLSLSAWIFITCSQMSFLRKAGCLTSANWPTRLPMWLSGKESTRQAADLCWFLGREDILEKEMTTHSSILAWRIPWAEEPGGLQAMGSQSQTRLSG